MNLVDLFRKNLQNKYALTNMSFILGLEINIWTLNCLEKNAIIMREKFLKSLQNLFVQHVLIGLIWIALTSCIFFFVSWSWVLWAWWNCHVQKSGMITKSYENRTSTSSLSWGLFHLSTCDSRGAIFIVGVVLWYKCALIYLKYIRKLQLMLHYWGRPHGEPCAIDSK